MSTNRRTIGKILTFSGLGLAVSGLLIGLWANDEYEDQFRSGACIRTKPPTCNSIGQSETSKAEFAGNVGTGVGITGLVAVGVGVFLWLTAPSAESVERQVTFAPTLTNDSAGITAVGRF